MQKIQTRVLETIERWATDAGLDAAINYDFANTGEIVFYEGGSLRPIGSMGFSFQKGYAVLKRDKRLGNDRMLEYGNPDFEKALRGFVKLAIGREV